MSIYLTTQKSPAILISIAEDMPGGGEARPLKPTKLPTLFSFYNIIAIFNPNN